MKVVPPSAAIPTARGRDARVADGPAAGPQAPPEADAWRFLQVAARLMLRYNFRTGLIKRRLVQTARRLGLEALVLVAYREISIFGPEGRQFHAEVHEFRIDVAVSIEVNRVLESLDSGRLPLAEAIPLLEAAEAGASRHRRGMLALIFGLAASALAWLLQADSGAVAVTGVASALGLLVRQELAKRRLSLFALPFAAALIGALLGGIVIRLGWTETPGFCLMVPALMLVPGPHLINGVYDMVENHMQTGLCRLGLAAGILVAAALGVFLGGWITLGFTTVAAQPSAAVPMSLGLDAILAGVAACGFGAFYNAPWRVLWISILCGLVGHGIRFATMGNGVSQEIATLFACLAIGLLAGLAAGRARLPFSAVAFAGAVPMMPGVLIYQGIAGAMDIARIGAGAEPALVAGTLADLFRAAFVIGAMALGLLAGARVSGFFRRRRY